ncbi:MAG: hypothetical protein PVI42_12340, partial [Desulfobacterales bacterium]
KQYFCLVVIFDQWFRSPALYPAELRAHVGADGRDRKADNRSSPDGVAAPGRSQERESGS